MNKCQVLAQGGKFGDVRVNCKGEVFLNLFYNDMCLKFSPEGFMNFSSMIEKASNGLMGKVFFDSETQKND